MKRSNVSVFVPFAGCPNRCSFCDQHSITGVCEKTTPEDVKAAVETALSSGGIDAKKSEIAFFGGSFTAIDREYMLSLLNATKPYIDRFKGIRISTRPDCIDEEILEILREYGVTAIELGAQSMCDDVLLLNDRGHDSEAVRKASQLIKANNISLGLQMMTGLYGSSYEKDIFTAEEFIRLKPDTVRVYPTVTLKNTKLEKLFISGEYVPDTVEYSLSLCAKLIRMFENEGVSVIRVGLHSSDTMENSMLAGAYHPAFRELCESKIFYDLLLEGLDKENIKQGNITVHVAKSAVSKLTGQKKSNLTKLRELGYNVKVLPSENLSARQIIIEEG